MSTAEKLDRIVESRFVCPKCGASKWGTSAWDHGKDKRAPFSKWMGHCNNCHDFSWMRTQDWKFFQFTVRPTRAEYDRFRALEDQQHNRMARRSKAVRAKGNATDERHGT